jgi:hypothetical protein
MNALRGIQVPAFRPGSGTRRSATPGAPRGLSPPFSGAFPPVVRCILQTATKARLPRMRNARGSLGSSRRRIVVMRGRQKDFHIMWSEKFRRLMSKN